MRIYTYEIYIYIYLCIYIEQKLIERSYYIHQLTWAECWETSLAVQRLRLCLPMQTVQVQSHHHKPKHNTAAVL